MASEQDGLKPEQYYQRHQRAFRCAFDYLNSHFPPVDDPEWWERTAKDGQAACASMLDEPLAVQLLIGVFSYLEKEWKERRKQNGGADN